jgi:hypothetical protein
MIISKISAHHPKKTKIKTKDFEGTEQEDIRLSKQKSPAFQIREHAIPGLFHH